MSCFGLAENIAESYVGGPERDAAGTFVPAGEEPGLCASKESSLLKVIDKGVVEESISSL